jgi:hypothetical protein
MCQFLLLVQILYSCVLTQLMYQLQVHFRGYPSEILSPCEGEDSVKWSYMNSLKEVCFENQNYYHVLSQRNL